ncbi:MULTISPECIES: hypothetical protein [unclassified Saccharicrinis]|uniref:hypothetical protein n=1 Tax=unclassified Saccharicrinis TaxID=2646859 RepID=UPI003D339183
MSVTRIGETYAVFRNHKLLIQAKFSASNPLMDYIRNTQPLDLDSNEQLPNSTEDIRTDDDVICSGI